MGIGISLAERGLIPDFPIKLAIRRLLKQRLKEIEVPDGVDPNLEFAKILEKAAIAENTQKANSQHYEVPARFFQLVLGERLKYSSCYYESGAKTLNEAEVDMLELYQQRAKIEDGNSVLDLGCGWGSFTLWIAERCPNSMVTGVSNSHSQRIFITEQAENKGLTNVNVITADMNKFDLDSNYDRIVSIEMFEHMRNYDKLFAKVANWLSDDGYAFVHVFSHRVAPYFFETEGDDNWMGRYFFTGGIMPSRDLYKQYEHLLEIDQSWTVNGINYGKTSLHWLENMDKNRDEIMGLFVQTYGRSATKIWFNRWRLFFLSCAELFLFREGNEWDVSHFRFQKPKKGHG